MFYVLPTTNTTGSYWVPGWEGSTRWLQLSRRSLPPLRAGERSWQVHYIWIFVCYMCMSCFYLTLHIGCFFFHGCGFTMVECSVWVRIIFNFHQVKFVTNFSYALVFLFYTFLIFLSFFFKLFCLYFTFFTLFTLRAGGRRLPIGRSQRRFHLAVCPGLRRTPCAHCLSLPAAHARNRDL